MSEITFKIVGSGVESASGSLNGPSFVDYFVSVVNLDLGTRALPALKNIDSIEFKELDDGYYINDTTLYIGVGIEFIEALKDTLSKVDPYINYVEVNLDKTRSDMTVSFDLMSTGN